MGKWARRKLNRASLKRKQANSAKTIISVVLRSVSRLKNQRKEQIHLLTISGKMGQVQLRQHLTPFRCHGEHVKVLVKLAIR